MRVTSLEASAILKAATKEYLVFTILHAHQIPLTKRIDVSQLAGVVYAKPNVENHPPTYCKFYPVPGTVGRVSDIYSTASVQDPGGVNGVDADDSGWPSPNRFDVNLYSLGFHAGQYVAIAFNIDDDINNNGTEYSFSCGRNVFDPTDSILEGDDTDALCWLNGDDFQGGVKDGLKGKIGKTIVVVCRLVPTTGSNRFIGFNLNVRAVNASSDTDTSFDPKIKNDG